MSFVRKYRDSGFLIVIDDFGCEHSNIDRLIQIHPDIIKVDRSIISCIENDPYRQSILKSIHSLAEMTGYLCLAEGVETLAEIKTCHLLGVDLFQGFAIACPSPDIPRLEEATRTQVRILQGEFTRKHGRAEAPPPPDRRHQRACRLAHPPDRPDQSRILTLVFQDSSP